MKKVIVQLGACNGKDHVRQFKDEELYLVEPNLQHIESLQEQYPDSTIVTNAIVPLDNIGTVTMWYSNLDGPKYEVTSLDKYHILDHGYPEESLESFTTDGITLDELLDAFELKKVDILFLDIEGVEEKVLLEFPFEKYDITELQVEALHLRDRDKLTTFLSKQGYRYTGDTYDYNNFDILFRKE